MNTSNEPGSKAHGPPRGKPYPLTLAALSSRLSRCAAAVDHVRGYVDALDDVLAKAADEYGEALLSRLYLTQDAARQLERISSELTVININLHLRMNRKHRAAKRHGVKP